MKKIRYLLAVLLITLPVFFCGGDGCDSDQGQAAGMPGCTPENK